MPGGETIDIRRIDDLESVKRLGLAAGLEESGREDEDVLAAWGAYEGERLVGAICLERRGDLCIPNWLSVAETHRRRGVAAELHEALETEARRLGAGDLWVTARAPGFFVAQGYETVPGERERALLLEACLECPQCGRGCDPKALTKPIDDQAVSDCLED